MIISVFAVAPLHDPALEDFFCHLENARFAGVGLTDHRELEIQPFFLELKKSGKEFFLIGS